MPVSFEICPSIVQKESLKSVRKFKSLMIAHESHLKKKDSNELTTSPFLKSVEKKEVWSNSLILNEKI